MGGASPPLPQYSFMGGAQLGGAQVSREGTGRQKTEQNSSKVIQGHRTLNGECSRNWCVGQARRYTS
jgi:hypothetical protein